MSPLSEPNKSLRVLSQTLVSHFQLRTLQNKQNFPMVIIHGHHLTPRCVTLPGEGWCPTKRSSWHFKFTGESFTFKQKLYCCAIFAILRKIHILSQIFFFDIFIKNNARCLGGIAKRCCVSLCLYPPPWLIPYSLCSFKLLIFLFIDWCLKTKCYREYLRRAEFSKLNTYAIDILFIFSIKLAPLAWQQCRRQLTIILRDEMSDQLHTYEMIYPYMLANLQYK